MIVEVLFRDQILYTQSSCYLPGGREFRYLDIWLLLKELNWEISKIYNQQKSWTTDLCLLSPCLTFLWFLQIQLLGQGSPASLQLSIAKAIFLDKHPLNERVFSLQMGKVMPSDSLLPATALVLAYWVYTTNLKPVVFNSKYLKKHHVVVSM